MGFLFQDLSYFMYKMNNFLYKCGYNFLNILVIYSMRFDALSNYFAAVIDVLSVDFVLLSPRWLYRMLLAQSSIKNTTNIDMKSFDYS